MYYFLNVLYLYQNDTTIIPMNGFYTIHDGNLLTKVGFEPTPTEVDCDQNAQP